MPHRVVQLRHNGTRRVAIVDEPHLRLIDSADSVYALAMSAIENRESLVEAIERRATGERLEYDPVYFGQSGWRLLPPFDHPDEPARCLVS